MILWKGKQNWQTLVRLTKKKKRIQINQIKNERRDVTTDTTETEIFIRDYYNYM